MKIKNILAVSILCPMVWGSEPNQLAQLSDGRNVQISYNQGLTETQTGKPIPYLVSGDYYQIGKYLIVPQPVVTINLKELRTVPAMFLGEALSICLERHCANQIVLPYLYLSQCTSLCEGIALVGQYAEIRDEKSIDDFKNTLKPYQRECFDDVYRKFGNQKGDLNVGLLLLFNEELRRSLFTNIGKDETGKVLYVSVQSQVIDQALINARQNMVKIKTVFDNWAAHEKELLPLLKSVQDKKSAREAVSKLETYQNKAKKIWDHVQNIAKEYNIDTSLWITLIVPRDEANKKIFDNELSRLKKESYYGSKELFYVINGK